MYSVALPFYTLGLEQIERKRERFFIFLIHICVVFSKYANARNKLFEF
jgi:hypothetical protein